MMQRRAVFTLVMTLLVLVIALTACGAGEPVAVTRLAAETTEDFAPVEPELPRPVATAAAPGSSAWLQIGGSRPLHGSPPYTAQFLATLYGTPAADCSHLVWRFGDGQEVRQPCGTAAVEGATWQVSHRYEEPGTYHARARLELGNSTALESEKPQTVIVATPQGATLRETVVRWIGCIVLLTVIGAALIALAFLRGRRRTLGAGLLVLFLITFVPPFSYVPDPLGIVLTALGSYRYDPRLPLGNRFVMRGDPTENLRPYLDGLIGETGLDPLDPVSPLAGYAFVKVVQRQHHTDVHALLSYEDGTERVYPVPLRQPQDVIGFYACCWRYDGLGRLRTEHRALDPVPFAGGKTVRLGTPQRLSLSNVEGQDPQTWFAAAGNPSNPRMVWSPQGDAFLTPTQDGVATALRLLVPDAGSATRVADNVWEYGWLPDGSGILYSTVASAGGPERQVYRVGRDGREAELLLALPAGESAFPAISEVGLWYAQGGALWLLPLEGGGKGTARRLADLPEQPTRHGVARPVQVSPAADGQRVAYTCGAAVCLIDADGSNHVVAAADARPVSLAWRPDGQQVAAVFWDYAGRESLPATLRLIDRDGTIAGEVAVAPDGPVEVPQWLPDGTGLLLQSFPQDGRRILFVDRASLQVTDLSQPRWDAFFALHPDGDRVLVSNGRGGFWLSTLRR